jgi:hypothetical protein
MHYKYMIIYICQHRNSRKVDISAIRIVDIRSWPSTYIGFNDELNGRYPQWELWISTIRTVGIHILQAALWISTIRIVWKSTIAVELRISTIVFVDILNSQCGYQQIQLWISTIAFLDIRKSD